MAGNRIDLHNKFVEILGTQGQLVSRVYFQPPPSVKLEYPCIIYKRYDQKDFFSNDKIYLRLKRYSVTVVDKNTDSQIPDMVGALRYSSFSSHFAIDGLNHDVYSLYF